MAEQLRIDSFYANTQCTDAFVVDMIVALVVQRLCLIFMSLQHILFTLYNAAANKLGSRAYFVAIPLISDGIKVQGFTGCQTMRGSTLLQNPKPLNLQNPEP